jgi:hypothetical protein
MENKDANQGTATVGNILLGEVSSPNKAYQIDLSKIEEGFLYDTIMCYADNANQAKQILLRENRYENLILSKSNEEVNYLTIPVIRRKSDDKIIFEGKAVTETEKNRILFKRERLAKLDAILNDESIKYCYIRKGNWYRPNACGYTDFKHRAGVFTKEEAVSDAKSCQELDIVPINIVEHNEMINSEISCLSSRLL